MKLKFLFSIAFALVLFQGWASPIDSLNMKTKVGNLTSKVQGFVNLKDSLPFVIVGTAIKVNPTSLDFGSVTIGEKVTKTFTVKGTRLNGPLTLELHLTRSASSTEKFTLSRTSISATQAQRGVTVSVTYAPNEPGADGGTIYIKGGGAEPHTVTLSGTGVAAPSPSITVSPTTVVIPAGENTGRFTVRGSNLTGPLTIKSNSPQVTVSPTTITAAEAKAGKTVTVACSPSFAGHHSATITVSGGGAESKTVTVVKMSEAISVDIYPSASTVDFGTVVKGNCVSKAFSVTGTNLTSPLTMTLNDESGSFTINRSYITPDEAASGAAFTILYMPKSVGSHTAKLIINCGSTVIKEITLTGKCVVPTITVNPTSLSFGNVVKGNNPTKTFKVTGTDLTGSLTVSSSNSDYFTVSPTTITAAQAAAGATVTVTYKATAVGSHAATIVVSGGGATKKTVSVSGTCVAPSITITPSSGDFGTVVLGESKSKTFTLKGTNVMTPLTVTLYDPTRSFSSNITTISPSQAASGITFIVTYKPTSVGTHTATIKISGGGGATTTIITITLTGRCVEGTPMMGQVEPDEENGDNYDLEVREARTGIGNAIISAVEDLFADVKIYAEGQNIIIESDVEHGAIISDIAGHAYRVTILPGRNEIPANGSGIHIVRIGDQTAKLMIR